MSNRFKRVKDRDMRKRGEWDKDRHIRIKRSVRFKGEKEIEIIDLKVNETNIETYELKCPLDLRE